MGVRVCIAHRHKNIAAFTNLYISASMQGIAIRSTRLAYLKALFPAASRVCLSKLKKKNRTELPGVVY